MPRGPDGPFAFSTRRARFGPSARSAGARSRASDRCRRATGAAGPHRTPRSRGVRGIGAPRGVSRVQLMEQPRTGAGADPCVSGQIVRGSTSQRNAGTFLLTPRADEFIARLAGVLGPASTLKSRRIGSSRSRCRRSRQTTSAPAIGAEFREGVRLCQGRTAISGRRRFKSEIEATAARSRRPARSPGRCGAARDDAALSGQWQLSR